MSNPFHNELKKEFQLERMILFSDAVFAIAITLLAIEIKVPEFDHQTVTDHALLQKMLAMIPKFIGFLVSFFVIGVYWVAHHRFFGYVVNYDMRLLWLNLFFLLAVVLMPFSSGLYSEYVTMGIAKLPVIIYVLNIVFLATMSLVLWEYITDPKRALTQGVTPVMRKYIRYRSLVPMAVFLLTGIVYIFINSWVAVWMPMLIPIGMRFVRRNVLTPKQIKR